LITSLRSGCDRNIIDLIQWQLRIAFKESAHCSHHDVIGSSAHVQASGLTKWGSDCIN
jgi:hypothetical protein